MRVEAKSHDQALRGRSFCTKEEAVGSDFAERLLVEAAATLQNEMPNLSASQLDYQVRLYQRSR